MTFKAVALGFGSMKKEASEQLLRSWIKIAELDDEKPERKSPEQFIAQMDAMGITVKIDDCERS